MRLLRQLQARQPDLQRWDGYFEGDQPLAFASQKFRDAFGERFPAFTSNFCGTVIEAVAERLEVAGFKFGSEAASESAWDLWQANDLDSASQQAHQEALIKGSAYGLVEPAEGYPAITIEDALDTIVEHDPRTRRKRRAALKRWVDDEGRLVVYLYTPENIFKFRTRQKWLDEYSRWWLLPGPWEEGYQWRLWDAAAFEPYELPGEVWPAPNSIGVVPVVELPNRPRLSGQGQSDLAPIRSNQDAINKYRADALIASEFAAYPQRYLLNFEPETDEQTGRAKEPFRAAIDRLWIVPPPDPDLGENAPQVSIGQLPAASLEPYARMIELEVSHLASNSDVPFYRLLGGPQSVPPSGESIKSAEAGLERKISRAELFLGEGWEELLRVGLRAQGNTAAAEYRKAETVWVDSATRNEAVRTDAVVKLHGSKIIDDELAWEMAGLSRRQIAELKERKEAREAAAKAAGEPPPSEEPEPQLNGGIVAAPQGPRMGTPAGVS